VEALVGPVSLPAARYAVCEGVLRQGSFADDVALTAAAGIAGLGVDGAAVDVIGVDEAARVLDGEGERASSYVTLADILPGNDGASLDELRYERPPLDSGAVPVASLVGQLESSGYEGWYENEILVRMPRDQRLDMLRASREWFEAR
jgi:hypothetical protein